MKGYGYHNRSPMEHPLGQASPQSPTYKWLGPFCEEALKGECHNLRTGGTGPCGACLSRATPARNFLQMSQESSALQLGLAQVDSQCRAPPLFHPTRIRAEQLLLRMGALSFALSMSAIILSLRLHPPNLPTRQHNMAVPPVELVGISRRLEDHPDIGILRQAGKVSVQLA